MIHRLASLSLMLLAALLASCTTTPASSLPLADDQPTFLFFYTDG